MITVGRLRDTALTTAYSSTREDTSNRVHVLAFWMDIHCPFPHHTRAWGNGHPPCQFSRMVHGFVAHNGRPHIQSS
jgi:hypothetical protein